MVFTQRNTPDPDASCLPLPSVVVVVVVVVVVDDAVPVASAAAAAEREYVLCARTLGTYGRFAVVAAFCSCFLLLLVRRQSQLQLHTACTPDMCCCRAVVIWGVRAHTLKCTRAVNANDTYGGSPLVKVGFVVLAALYCSSSSALFFFLC